MPNYKLVNGIEVELTAEEEADHAARLAEHEATAGLVEITERYAGKRAALQSDVLCALAMDGGSMEANLATLRARWVTLANAEDAEIIELFT